LRLNDFEPKDYSEDEAKELLKDLLVDSQNLHEYESHTVDHKNPLLVKYYYKFNKGVQKVKEDKEGTDITSYKEVNVKKFEQLQAPPAPQVKIELSETRLNLKLKLDVLKSGKKALTMLAEEVRELHAHVQLKVVEQPQVWQNAEIECKKKLEILENWLEDIRKHMVTWENKNCSEEDAGQHLALIKEKARCMLTLVKLLCCFSCCTDIFVFVIFPCQLNILHRSWRPVRFRRGLSSS
jgi:hypothetical protein